MAVYDFFLSRNASPVITAENYIGNLGRLFYDDATGELRISDGATPGGFPIPITIATATTAGSVRPGPGFSISPAGVLELNAGPMFELNGNNEFQLLPATAARLGGIRLGPGITLNAEDQIIIDSEGLDFSFGNFAAVTLTYPAGHPREDDEFAVLQTINANEDAVFASNGTGAIKVVGEFEIYRPDNGVAGALLDKPFFKVQTDGQIKILVPNPDPFEGAVEIVGSDTGGFLPPAVEGVMLKVTGNTDSIASIYVDAIGGNSAFVGRRYNGTAEEPTSVLNGETITRLAAAGYADDGFPFFGPGSIDIDAIEDFTNAGTGVEIKFRTAALGETVRETVARINNQEGVATQKVTLEGSTSGTLTLIATAEAGATTITLPATDGTVVTTGDSATVTNTMLAGSIANDKLVSSTISGIALGSDLAALSAGNFLTGSDYDGGTARTFAVDATSDNTASKVVARDSNGNFSAGTITSTLNGNADTATTATNLAAASTILTGTVTVDPPNIGSQSTNTQTATVTGLTTNHKVIVTSATQLEAGVVVAAAWASAANTLSIQFSNTRFNQSVNPGAKTITYFAWV